MFGSDAFSEVAFSALPDPRARMRVSVGLTAFLKLGAGIAKVGVTSTANWDFRVLAATTEFVALRLNGAPGDAQPYRGTLDKALRFERSLLGSGGIGAFTAGVGSMEVNNLDGSYDYLVSGYAVDGRPVKLRAGVEGDPVDAFVTIFAGTATDWHVDEDRLRIELRDRGHVLEVPAQPRTYAGTGGVNGTADLQGKRVPRAYGRCLNVEPPLLMPALKVFQVNDGPVQDIPAVYSRGVAVTRGADYPAFEALQAATIPPGTYVTCLAAGVFAVNFVLEGQITADVRGDAAGSGYVETAAGIVRKLVTGPGRVADPSGLYLPAFAAVDALQSAPIGLWLGTNDEISVSEVCARIMGSIGGWIGHRRSGDLEVGIFTAPAGVPVARIAATDIAKIQREPLPDQLTPPPWRYRVGYERIWTTQNDLAGAVGESRRAYLAESMRLAEASSQQVKTDHPLARDPDPVESYFALQADAQAEAERRLALFGRTNSLYRITLKDAPYLIELGDVVHVTYRRWDLVTGRLLRVVSVLEDSDDDSIEIVGFG